MSFHSPSLVCLLLAVWSFSPANGEEPLAYNRDVRPILSRTCFACHGPDSASRKADLRLDRRDDAIAAGAIVPGKVDESEMVRRLFSEEPEERMPPPDSHAEMTQAEREALKRWVAEGAVYEPHWSLVAPQRPPLPEVKQADWVRNPIDTFILARIEAAGLTPAPEVDRRTLCRRVTLDLTGLPPSVEDVETFVNDAAPDAYEKLVDRLMALPGWGEHRGRYWLDAARYADTHGIHFDNFREMWSYREWVIDAFNRNQPFDQFTVEQLAGDLLPGATLEQQIASGFNRCNMTTNEGGTIPEEYLVLYTRDRTETTSLVWLGMTAGCAVCHDHKFDPLTQREFYEMAAFFNNTTQAAMDGNIKDTPPIVKVPQDQDRARWDEVAKLLETQRGQLAERRQSAQSDFAAWLAAADTSEISSRLPEDGLALYSMLDEQAPDSLAMRLNGVDQTLPLAGLAWEAGHVAAKALLIQPGAVTLPEVGNFGREQAFSAAAWIKIADVNQQGAILARMDENRAYRGWDLWLEGGRIGTHLVHAWPDNAIKVVTKKALQPGRWHHVCLTHDGAGKPSGVHLYIDGERQPTEVIAKTLKDTIEIDVPLKLGQRHNGQPINGLAMQDLRIYQRGLTADVVQSLAQSSRALWLARKPAESRTPEETSELLEFWLAQIDPRYHDLSQQVSKLETERNEIAARGTVAHVMHERDAAAEAFVLFRGAYDQRRDPVKADTPDALPPMAADLPRNRLGFARWLLTAEHPLTSRVTVNRFWQQLFGAGLVTTAGDFGVTGDLPSHPKLLDWMAVEFRESGWDVKKFFKLLVTSATYRQSAVTTPEKIDKDPANELLSRGPRFRMDAEMVRDYALATSELLVKEIGGPSVKPYQPEGVWEAVAMDVSNTRNYQHDHGDSLYRRSLYTFWKRAAPPAQMELLNAPNRETCTVRRERTNTPLQALVTLNDTQFVEAARNLAQSVLLGAGSDTDARLDQLARRLLARPWRAEEAPVVRASLDELLASFAEAPDEARQLIAVGESKADAKLDPVELAAWTMLANELMNLDEVLTK
jgi:hypothetical protein